MGISSTRQRLVGLKRYNDDPWLQTDGRLLSNAPLNEPDNTSQSHLPMSNISFLPSDSHDEQSLSTEFFEDGGANNDTIARGILKHRTPYLHKRSLPKLAPAHLVDFER